MDKAREREIAQTVEEAISRKLRNFKEMMKKDGSLTDDEWLYMAEYIRDQVTYKWAIASTKATIKKRPRDISYEGEDVEVCQAPGMGVFGRAVQEILRAILSHLECIEVKKRTLGMNTPAQEIVNVGAEDRESFRSRGLRLVNGNSKKG